ncbi:MAG: hypothetical protein R3C99_07020 [Pirellulaceae bacterium]
MLLTLSVAGYLLLLGKPRMMWFVLGAVFGGFAAGPDIQVRIRQTSSRLVAHRIYVYTKVSRADIR